MSPRDPVADGRSSSAVAIHLIWAVVIVVIALFVTILLSIWMIVRAIEKLGSQMLDRDPWEIAVNGLLVVATAALPPAGTMTILIIANRNAAKLLGRWDREAPDLGSHGLPQEEDES